MKIVLPTIVAPWRDRIEACRTVADVQAAQDDLMRYVVLDPACGSGNFLYVAYRELRRIEAELRRRATDMRRNTGLREQQVMALYFPLANVKGIEMDPFAVQLARVTLWMGHKLAVDELDLEERVLPLGDLSGIRRGDALKLEWPRADAVIGNPPYHGTKLLRGELGDDYVDWLASEFGVGVKDYCVYWFRKAHDHLPRNGRAGLVGTNSIREGKNREASLEYVVGNGGVLTSVVSNQRWSGEANVHVSIVNWVKGPHAGPVALDGREVMAVSTRLRSGADHGLGDRLVGNRNLQFFGVVPSGPGFLLDDDEARALLARTDADYSLIVKRYLVGDDITTSPFLAPTRWIIDFGEQSLEDAARWPAALSIVRERVKPSRDLHKKARERLQWWKFSRSVPDLFDAVSHLDRFIACPAQSKRFHMLWCETRWCPSNLTAVFAFDSDFAWGVLQSRIHTGWATDQSTTLETRPRYTAQSFSSFPWPDAESGTGHADVSAIGTALCAMRSVICRERQIGLTRLYNEIDEGAHSDLRDLHEALDEAVAATYGWPASVAHDPVETNRRLLELNRAITAGEFEYRPFR